MHFFQNPSGFCLDMGEQMAHLPRPEETAEPNQTNQELSHAWSDYEKR
jgi:hypothetical protein